MPATIEKAAQSAKRKRISPDKRPSKRARSESSEEDGQAQILLLENEIFESKKNYNNIATLIKILESESEDGDDFVIAAISLCRVFTRLMVSGELTKKKGAAEKEIVVSNWLKERYSEYKNTLVEILAEDQISSTALTLCMRLLKTEGQHMLKGSDDRFPTEFLTEIVRVLLTADGDGSARKEFSEKFVEEYDDVRYYTLEAVR